MKGRFIVVEGIDGSGKSSHIEPIRKQLEELGVTSLPTREIGGTHIGEHLRNMVLHNPMSYESEILLALSSRIEHQTNFLKPRLAEGTWVVSDRYNLSTLAYQFGGRLNFEKYYKEPTGEQVLNPIHEQLELLTWQIGDIVRPDLTLIFDLPVEVAEQRRGNRSGSDKFERKEREFFERVRASYLSLAKHETESRKCAPEVSPVQVIDASKSMEEVTENVRQVINDYYKRQQPTIA